MSPALPLGIPDPNADPAAEGFAFVEASDHPDRADVLDALALLTQARDALRWIASLNLDHDLRDVAATYAGSCSDAIGDLVFVVEASERKRAEAEAEARRTAANDKRIWAREMVVS